MRPRPTRFLVRSSAITIVGGTLSALALFPAASSAQLLIGDPFISSYQGWIDPVTARAGNWRLSLHAPTMMETSGPVPTNPITPVANDGSYVPTLLIQNNYVTPTTYDFNARMYTSDDDLWGVVFGFQDSNNYYRVGFRSQANGNLGGTNGVSVQKVVSGVVTQISPAGTGTAYTAFPTFATGDSHTPVDIKVSVTGTNYSVFVTGENSGNALVSGSDAGLAAGKIGVQSWAQNNRVAANKQWGTEVESVSVTQGVNTLYSGTFVNPMAWRQMVMTNTAAVTSLTTGAGEDIGNFGNDINDKWIYQQSNGNENATATTPNIDAIGPAVVVNEPGATALTNYEMRVRMGSLDNDAYGVVVRAQDDNNFYRILFHNDPAAISTTRPPRGMSVQKVRGGVWTELYRDDQLNIPFLPGVGTGNPNTPGFPSFDLKVGAVGDTLKIQVKDQNGNLINYPLITDSSNPILAGSVGLATWGSTDVFFQGSGGLDTPLLKTLNSLKDVDVVINRATGNMTITNNDPTSVGIKGVSLQSPGGAMLSGTWSSIADNYDRPSAPTPGNGSVDPDDAWTITSSTVFNLSEAEQSGNGGTLGASASINLGSAWKKSRIEDVVADLTLADGSTISLDVVFSGTPYARSDLNVDGTVNASDWPLYYPNMLTDMSALTTVQQALAGDLDGDGDNDVNDFTLFKADYDLANGAGAFAAMIDGVPEPTSCALLLVSVGTAFAFRRRRPNRLLSVILGASAVLVISGTASAVGVDLTTFTTEAFPVSSGFAATTWTITPTTATHPSNADASVVYAPDSALNKRYIGLLKPGTDDDVVGFVIGFKPGDGQLFSAGADYLLIDWKGASQVFNFTDVVGGGAFFQDQTPSGNMPVGLALAHVTGTDPPTADEFWQHVDYVENPNGHITELARGTTLGSAAYNRANGTHLFDIRYTATNVTVLVDGVEQFNVNGSYPDGRFGLYSAWQGPPATFSNFEVVSATGFVGLSATVDQGTGEIKLNNTGTAAVDFDYYQFNSAASSLKFSTWNSLSDQNYQSVGGGNGQSWDEAGGSSNSALAEVYLTSNSTLAGSGSVSIGNAFNNTLNVHDLTLTYRLLSGLLVPATITYIGTPPGVPGDYNGNGIVDGGDYGVWRKGGPLMNEVATIGTATPEDYTEWRARFGNTSGSGSSLGGQGVPEPATLGLFVCVGLLMAMGRQRAVRQL